MSWNLFERIINALKPCEEYEQVPEELQSWPEGDTNWLEGDIEQQEDSQEPLPSLQETPGVTQ